jgi:predicted metal-dependent hydrolase
MDRITVRRMRFEFPAELDSVFIAGEPEESYTTIGLSLLLPYLEPYLIRSMKAARPLVKDEALRDDLDRFVAQEGQHYRQHRDFNDLFRDRGFDGLRALEEEVDAEYRRWSETRSLKWNLAYAEGFEAMTTALALTYFESDKGSWHPTAHDLFMWHLIEELEHRTVAFDVYQHVCGDYAYRLAVGTFAQWHLVRFVYRTTAHMLAADPRTATVFGGDAGRKAREPRLRARLSKLIPRVLKTYTPWYTPRDIALPPDVTALAERYSAEALSTS